MGTTKLNMNIENKITDGTDMDLALLGIKDIPVKQIALYHRVTKLDLSNNHIREIPQEFCQELTQLKRLDMSQNLLEHIPSNFGKLSKLRHLDLFSNKIQGVPLSFRELSELRWLDLKDNPLVPPISDLVGSCLTAKECESAARNLVAYLAHVQTKMLEKPSNLATGSFTEAGKTSNSGVGKTRGGAGNMSYSKSSSSLLRQTKLISSCNEVKGQTFLENKYEDTEEAKINKTQSDYTGFVSTQREIDAEKEAKTNIALAVAAKKRKAGIKAKTLPSAYIGPPLALCFNLLVRALLVAFFAVATISISLAMMADYRVIRDDIEYVCGFIFTNPALVNNYILELQTWVESYVHFPLVNLPMFPYVEQNVFVLFWMWLTNSLSVILDFSLHALDVAAMYSKSVWAGVQMFVTSWF